MSNASCYKILVIHGPNMNLLGFRKRGDGSGVTLDKLNRYLRKTASEKGLSLSIIQTNDEGRAVNHLQSMRKKIKGILLFPGPWQKSGHVINDTLEIISIPCITISTGEKKSIFNKIKNREEEDIYKSSEKALIDLEKLIKNNS